MHHELAEFLDDERGKVLRADRRAAGDDHHVLGGFLNGLFDHVVVIANDTLVHRHRAQTSTQTGQRQRVAVDDLAAGQRFADLDQLVTGDDQRHCGPTIDGDLGHLHRGQDTQSPGDAAGGRASRRHPLGGYPHRCGRHS